MIFLALGSDYNSYNKGLAHDILSLKFAEIAQLVERRYRKP